MSTMDAAQLLALARLQSASTFYRQAVVMRDEAILSALRQGISTRTIAVYAGANHSTITRRAQAAGITTDREVKR